MTYILATPRLGMSATNAPNAAMCSNDQGNGTGNIHDTILLKRVGSRSLMNLSTSEVSYWPLRTLAWARANSPTVIDRRPVSFSTLLSAPDMWPC